MALDPSFPGSYIRASRKLHLEGKGWSKVMTNGNESKEPASGPKSKEKQDPTEEDQAQKEGIWGKGNERAGRQGAGKKKGEFQPFKLTKMLDKLLRNKQALPF